MERLALITSISKTESGNFWGKDQKNKGVFIHRNNVSHLIAGGEETPKLPLHAIIDDAREINIKQEGDAEGEYTGKATRVEALSLFTDKTEAIKALNYERFTELETAKIIAAEAKSSGLDAKAINALLEVAV